MGTGFAQVIKIMDGTVGSTNKLVINSSGQVSVAPLVTGSAIIGSVSINQTTPGTTNLISLSDGTGSVINSLAAGTGQNGILVAQGATNFVLSSVNSSTSQLASGASFTGAIETIFSEQDISVLLTVDQPGTLTINQYIDLAGSHTISSWVFTIAAGVPFSRAFVGNGNYVNFVFHNTGASTTTTFDLNVAYGTLCSVTNLGNAPVSVNEINGTVLSLGQTTMTASLPVTIASNQSTLPVSIATAPVLVAGSAIIGKVGIDQTTVGTTNAVALAQIGSTTIVTGGVNGTIGIGGTAAQGASATGNPVRNGARSATSNPTALTNGQVNDLMLDKVGRQVVVQGQIRDLVGAQGTTITSSTSPVNVLTAVASTFTDITHISVTNGSASATTFTLSDGINSYIWNVPAGGGFVINYSPPLPATILATNWTGTTSVSVASVYVNVVFVKNL
jgi:hypothetical protein